MKSEIIKDAIICSRFDKRRKEIRKFVNLGYNKIDFLSMKAKHNSRRYKGINLITHQDRIKFLECLKTYTTFNLNAYSSRYNITGIDYIKYHRPSSNGKGWVLLAPDEPGNNVYIEDNIILQFLSNKYLKE